MYFYYLYLLHRFYEGDGCGGSLVAPDIVLTAAHCGDVFSAFDYDTKIIHPAYFQTEGYVTHDYMLLKLASPILTVDPVKLDDGSISSTYGLDKPVWTLGACAYVLS